MRDMGDTTLIRYGGMIFYLAESISDTGELIVISSHFLFISVCPFLLIAV